MNDGKSFNFAYAKNSKRPGYSIAKVAGKGTIVLACVVGRGDLEHVARQSKHWSHGGDANELIKLTRHMAEPMGQAKSASNRKNLPLMLDRSRCILSLRQC